MVQSPDSESEEHGAGVNAEAGFLGGDLAGGPRCSTRNMASKNIDTMEKADALPRKRILEECVYQKTKYMDVILSLHELMHHTHVKKRVGIVLKLDSKKAYDKVHGAMLVYMKMTAS